MKRQETNDTVTLEIDGYGSDGAGVSRLPDGQVVFVRGALRGERCRVLLQKRGKAASWGQMTELLRPSPHRQAQDCPYYPQCGGCQTRHMTYEEELSFKKERLEQALLRIGGSTVPVSRIHGAAETARYRNKAQFPVSAGPDGPVIGFYRAGSHAVIDVDDCLLQPVQTARLRRAVREWMLRHQVSAYDEQRHEGLIRHVFVRVNHRGESLCALVANGNALPHTDALIECLRRAEPGLCGLVLCVNKEKTNVILGAEFQTLWGDSTLHDLLCGFDFRLSVPSFFQVNRAQTELLYRCAADYAALNGRETLLDLYCGAGTITLALSGRTGVAVGAEIVPEAVEDAQENARRNGVGNVRFLCADAAEAAARLAQESLRPDVVTVDPPRKGLTQDLIDTIVQMAPRRVVYVSCDPATLARDVKCFSQKGFALRQIEAFDLFPRTVHVEAVALLTPEEG